MPRSSVPDPVRVTLLAILTQLDRLERDRGTKAREPALELSEIEERLSEVQPVESGAVHVALALGLLVRSGLVQARGTPASSWQRPKAAHQLYQITPEGRKYLVDALAVARATA